MATRPIIGLVVLISLFLVAQRGEGQGRKLMAQYVAGDIPTDAAAPAWQKLEPVTFVLSPQQIVRPFGGGAVREVAVKASHNGQAIAFLLEWADDSMESDLSMPDAFSDAVALQFPAEAQTFPSPYMGDEQNAVNIWQWQAAWQRDLEAPYADLEQSRPKYGDFYPDERLRPLGDRIFRAGEAAGNWRSTRERATPAENLVAQGFGSLTPLPHQDVWAWGTWQAGRWKVVFVRTLATGLAGDATFRAGETTSLNVAVWQGSRTERGARKSVSLAWQTLELAALPSPARPVVLPVVPEQARPSALWVALAALAGLLLGVTVAWALRRPRTS